VTYNAILLWYSLTSQNCYDVLQITPDITPDIWSIWTTSPQGTRVPALFAPSSPLLPPLAFWVYMYVANAALHSLHVYWYSRY